MTKYNLPKTVSERLDALERSMGSVQGSVTGPQDLVTKALLRTPSAPANLSVNTSSYMDEFGNTHGKINASWDPVTTATQGYELEIAGYELWGRPAGTAQWRRLTASVDIFGEYQPFDPGSDWVFRVRAIGRQATSPGEWSNEVPIQIAKDLDAPPIPSVPVLDNPLGTIKATWDGAPTMPSDFDRVELAMSATPGATEVVGTLNSPGTILIVGQPAGALRYFRLRAVDKSGNTSGWSGESSIAATQVVDPQEITDAVEEALENMDLNLVPTVSPNAPTPTDGEGKPVDALWTQYDAATNQVIGSWRWDGSAWLPLPLDGSAIAADSITATQIAAGTITATEIDAGAITSEKILAGAITTEKIDANAITGDKIAANTITANEIEAGTITSELIAAGAITSEKILAGAVTASMIAADEAGFNAAVIQELFSNNIGVTGELTAESPDFTTILSNGGLQLFSNNSMQHQGTIPVEGLRTEVQSIATSGTNLYVLTEGTGVRTIKRMSLTGTILSTISPTSPWSFSRIAATSTNLYCLSRSSAPFGWRVERRSLTGTLLSTITLPAISNATETAYGNSFDANENGQVAVSMYRYHYPTNVTSYNTIIYDESGNLITQTTPTTDRVSQSICLTNDYYYLGVYKANSTKKYLTQYNLSGTLVREMVTPDFIWDIFEHNGNPWCTLQRTSGGPGALISYDSSTGAPVFVSNLSEGDTGAAVWVSSNNRFYGMRTFLNTNGGNGTIVDMYDIHPDGSLRASLDNFTGRLFANQAEMNTLWVSDIFNNSFSDLSIRSGGDLTLYSPISLSLQGPGGISMSSGGTLDVLVPTSSSLGWLSLNGYGIRQTNPGIDNSGYNMLISTSSGYPAHWFSLDGTTSGNNPRVYGAPTGLYLHSGVGKGVTITSGVLITADGNLTTTGLFRNPGATTTTNPANILIQGSDGRIYRVTSSARSKIDVQTVGVDPSLVLDLEPKDWYDRTDMEAYAECLTNPDTAIKPADGPFRRIPGLVAEDLEEIGLNEFVMYDYDPEDPQKKETSGVMYDRLWTLLIPVVRNLRDKVNDLQSKIDEMENDNG